MNFCHRVTRFIFLILTLKSRNLLLFLGWNSKWSHCNQYKRIKMSLYPLKMAPTLISIIRFSSYYGYSLCYGKYSFESNKYKLTRIDVSTLRLWMVLKNQWQSSQILKYSWRKKIKRCGKRHFFKFIDKSNFIRAAVWRILIYPLKNDILFVFIASIPLYVFDHYSKGKAYIEKNST